jgi:lysophospholipase L1-like esterase
MISVHLRSLAVLLLCSSAIVAGEPSPYRSKEAWQRAVPKNYQRRAEFAFVEADPRLPNVLIIGDSNSMRYTVGVRDRLKGTANVFRAPDNCRSTRQTLQQIEIYLGHLRWDVIHFNWGMHDLTHLNDAGTAAPPPAGKLQVPPDRYEQNLRKLIERLKKTKARLIWATTTPVGRKTEERGFRRDCDVVDYNAIAAEVMKASGVEVNDLYTLTKPRAEQLLSDGVHFNKAGQKLVAKTVAAAIRKQLWLWSIDSKDRPSGKWRRECRLLDRQGAFYRDADGFHPAGAVIDEQRGVQHIFIYSGHPNGPAGVFRITRTLDTPKLAAFLTGLKP